MTFTESITARGFAEGFIIGYVKIQCEIFEKLDEKTRSIVAKYVEETLSESLDEALPEYFMKHFGRILDEDFSYEKNAGIREAAVSLYSEGISKDIISAYTGLSVEKIDKLIEDDRHS